MPNCPFIIKNISLSFFFFLFSIAYCQTPKQWAKLADEASAEGDYLGASIYYKNALSTDSSDAGLIFKYAESLRKCNDYGLAEYYYNKVGSSNDLALFWQAMMQKFNGDYESAEDNFKKFEKIHKDKSSYFIKKAKQEIKSCAYAKKLILDSVEVRIINAGLDLNSTYAELSPVIQNDTTLLYSSLRMDSLPGSKNNYQMMISRAQYLNAKWVAISNLDTSINNPGFHNGNGSFSADRQKFYFSRCAMSPERKCDLFRAEIKNGKWQTPVKLEQGINVENYTSTQPVIASLDGAEILFFVSDMPGGKGKMDLWYSEIKNGNSYSKPKNLSKINSIDNELSPWFDSKNKTLYFSSDWYYGLGGFDIFKCKGNLKSFSSPENLGYPYNTSVNDLYFSYYPEKNSGFITSNRKGSFSRHGETCCNDIYIYDFPVEEKADSLKSEQKYSSLEMLNKYLPVTLYFHNDEPNPRSWDTATTINYLASYEQYSGMIDTYRDEYSKGLTDGNGEKAKTDIENFFSEYVEKGVNDLELFTELLLRELEKGEKIELTVKGYASPLAKTDYNVNLTLRRISSLENYLRETPDGVFIPYLDDKASNGGRLDFVRIPFGEYNADTAVSDNLQDQRNSVYSRKAALERKIEIISVKHADRDSIFPEISFEEEIFDFGKMEQGETRSHIFRFFNSGKDTFKIKDISTSCGCTVAKWTHNELIPGSEGEIEIVFDTKGKLGKQVKTVTIESNAVPSTKVIHITAEIIGK